MARAWELCDSRRGLVRSRHCACRDCHPRDLTEPGSVDRVDTVDVLGAGFDVGRVDIRRGSAVGDLELDEGVLLCHPPQYEVACRRVVARIPHQRHRFVRGRGRQALRRRRRCPGHVRYRDAGSRRRCSGHPRDLTEPGSVDRVDTVDVLGAGFDVGRVDIRRGSAVGDLKLGEGVLPRDPPQYQVSRYRRGVGHIPRQGHRVLRGGSRQVLRRWRGDIAHRWSCQSGREDFH